MSIFEKEIKHFMTNSPQTVSLNQSLQYATDTMKKLDIRHLPVLEGGKLVGILSERDIRFVESFDKLDPKELLVEDAYTEEPLVLAASTLLNSVCEQMVSRKIGSVLIEENSKLAGIFTWIDALKLISNNSKGAI